MITLLFEVTRPQEAAVEAIGEPTRYIPMGDPIVYRLVRERDTGDHVIIVDDREKLRIKVDPISNRRSDAFEVAKIAFANIVS